jgi:hypothetical protein
VADDDDIEDRIAAMRAGHVAAASEAADEDDPFDEEPERDEVRATLLVDDGYVAWTRRQEMAELDGGDRILTAADQLLGVRLPRGAFDLLGNRIR